MPDDTLWTIQKPHIDLYLTHQKKDLGDDCLFQSLFAQLKGCYPDHRAIYTDGSKVKVGVLRPVQQPGSYWDRSSELPLVGLEPTEVTAYD